MHRMQRRLQGPPPRSKDRQPGLPHSPLAAPEGGLGVADRDLSEWIHALEDASVQDAKAVAGVEDRIRVALFEMAELLEIIEKECARIGARVRVLERRPVIQVEHSYREGI